MRNCFKKKRISLVTLFKKGGVVFAGGIFVVVLAVIILFNPLSGQITHFTKFVSEKFSILGAELPTFFFPDFPQRLMYAASEITSVSEELVSLNEELYKFINEECNCKHAESQCQQVMTEGIPTGCEPIGVFGEPCPKIPRVKEIDKSIQSEIHDLTLRLSFLQKLLKEEMDAGLEKQLATLRPEDAKILEDNLRDSPNSLLNLVPKIKEAAEDNVTKPNDCDVKKCTPECKLGTKFTLNACFLPGEQKPIELKMAVGVGLEDLDLGKVKIKDVNLSLPEEIEITGLPELPGLTISIPDITLTCQTRSLTFHTPTPSLPESPTLTLSCPEYPSYSSYQCAPDSQKGEENFREFEWWSQTFAWLSEKCQGTIQGEYGTPVMVCLKPEEVVTAVVNECDRRWNECSLFSCPNIPDVCQKIGAPRGFSFDLPWELPWNWRISREEAAKRRCQDLFNQEGETPPASCSSDAIGTTRGKCNQLREAGRELLLLDDEGKIIKVLLEPCLLLPLFVGRLENPSGEVILGQGGECPSQTIGDYPNPVPGCELAFPSVPKISFPKIIIPDIHLPTFSFPPFFTLKLPNFIFEDLILPDLELCDLSDCQFKFPNLQFKPPILKIPEIKTSAEIDIPGIPKMDIDIAPLQFPPLSFNLPQIINLGSLITPELEMPKIPLPQPKLQMSFKGLEIDLLNLLLGLFKWPSGGCWSGVKYAPVVNIVYPDKIFPWPAFPEIPEIPFCKDVRKFCNKINDSIKEITEKNEKIQEVVNTVFQNKVQQKLDKVASKIQQEIQQEIDQQLDDQAENIRKALEGHIAKYGGPEYAVSPETGAPMPGVWPVGKELPCDKIPPLTIPMQNINIAAKKLSEIWFREFGEPFPDKISIDWPDELKKISIRNWWDSSKTPCENDSQCPTDEKCYPDKKCFKPLEYELPTIPLSELSYPKAAGEARTITKRIAGQEVTITLTGKGNVNIRLPGLQQGGLPSIDLGLVGEGTECVSKSPSGGNPCQLQAGQIQANLETIKGIRDEITQSSQNIKDVLY